MKKTIVVFGLISGAVSSAMMLATVPFADRLGHSLVLGYTTMVLSFLLVFFGVRSYRDNQLGGQIDFGRAFVLGLGITLISCICYVVTWEVLSHTVFTDFMTKYTAQAIDKARASGGSPAEIQAKIDQLRKMAVLYANPFWNVLFTFIEPFPVGLAMSLLSAAILRKKAPAAQALAAVV